MATCSTVGSALHLFAFLDLHLSCKNYAMASSSSSSDFVKISSNFPFQIYLSGLMNNNLKAPYYECSDECNWSMRYFTSELEVHSCVISCHLSWKILTNFRLKNFTILGRSPGLVVMGGDSCFRGCKFESQHRILDGHFSHVSVVRIVMFVWKDEKKRKRDQGWQSKKIQHIWHVDRTIDSYCCTPFLDSQHHPTI